MAKTIDLTSGGIDHHPVVKNALWNYGFPIAGTMGYIDTLGVLPCLRERIRELWSLPKEGEVVITSSATEALNILHYIYHGKWSVENPSYFGLWKLHKLREQPYVAWNIPEEIEEGTTVYLCPMHHPATGTSLSQESFNKVQTCKSPLVEDMCYSTLGFAWKTPPSIIGTRTNTGDCAVGTFAKILGPGMRCGWIWCRDKDIARKCNSIKHTVNLGHPYGLYHTLLKVVSTRLLSEIIEHNEECWMKVRKHIVNPVSTTGGIFTTIRASVDACAKEDVLVDPIAPYYADRLPTGMSRVNFVRNPIDDTLEALRRLEKVQECASHKQEN